MGYDWRAARGGDVSREGEMEGGEGVEEAEDPLSTLGKRIHARGT